MEGPRGFKRNRGYTGSKRETIGAGSIQVDGKLRQDQISVVRLAGVVVLFP